MSLRKSFLTKRYSNFFYFDHGAHIHASTYMYVYMQGPLTLKCRLRPGSQWGHRVTEVLLSGHEVTGFLWRVTEVIRSLKIIFYYFLLPAPVYGRIKRVGLIKFFVQLRT